MAIAAKHDRSLNCHSEAKAHTGSQAPVWTNVEFQQLGFRPGQTAPEWTTGALFWIQTLKSFNEAWALSPQK